MSEKIVSIPTAPEAVPVFLAERNSEYMDIFDNNYIPIFPQIDLHEGLPTTLKENQMFEISADCGIYKKHDVVVFLGKCWVVIQKYSKHQNNFEKWLIDKKVVENKETIVYDTEAKKYSSMQLQGLWEVWQDACGSTISG